jgi:hypothetical protein
VVGKDLFLKIKLRMVELIEIKLLILSSNEHS